MSQMCAGGASIPLRALPLSAPDAAKLLRADYERWGRIIKETGIRADG